MKKYWLFIFLIVSNLFFITIAQASPKPVLKFATEATYPPFVYTTNTGKVMGFDVAIVQALCRQMKATCTISNQPWDSLIPSLKIGKYDAVFGGMAITALRAKQVNFTKSYYYNTVSFVANKARRLVLSKKGLQGKIIGVQGGTTFDMYLQATYGNDVKIYRYPSEQEALMDLSAGRVDAVLGDTPLINRWIKNNPDKSYKVVGKPIQNIKYFGKGMGIAINKHNSKLLIALNEALIQIKMNGVYQKIFKQYFD